MSPDLLFIGSGVLAAGAALVLLIKGCARRQRSHLLSAALWGCLAAGCLLQGLSPNLRIERNAFVIDTAKSASAVVDAPGMVEREREMKKWSLAFLVVAGVGLFFQYRGLLFGKPSGPPAGAAAGESSQ